MLAIALVSLPMGAWLALASGCQSQPTDIPPTMGDASPPVTDKTDKKIGDQGTDGIMATFLTDARTVTYEVKTDRQKPKRHTSQFSTIDDHTWLLSVSDLRKIWFQSVNGEIHVLRDVDYAENVSVEYEPPLAFLSPNLSPDKPIEGKSKMVVRDLRTNAIRDQGTCAYSVVWVANKKAESAFGELDVIHIRMTRKIKLNLATVDITIDQLRHPKFGLVRGYTVRSTKALGLIGGTTTEDMVLLNAPPTNATGGVQAEGRE